MTDNLGSMKQRFFAMVIGDMVLLAAAGACAFLFFVNHVGWALWGFLGLIVAAFGLQLWFIGGVARTGKGD
jgi:hypothetical protein